MREIKTGLIEIYLERKNKFSKLSKNGCKKRKSELNAKKLIKVGGRKKFLNSSCFLSDKRKGRGLFEWV